MQETLEELLARLKAEIEDAEHGDVDRAELARLAKAVESKLAADEDDEKDDDDDSLTEDLNKGVVRWEASHPELARFLHQAADTLGGVGL